MTKRATARPTEYHTTAPFSEQHTLANLEEPSTGPQLDDNTIRHGGQTHDEEVCKGTALDTARVPEGEQVLSGRGRRSP